MALVVKYSDNVLKGFATSVAIILSTVVSVFLFDSAVNLSLCVGIALVIAATYLYTREGQPQPSAKALLLPVTNVVISTAVLASYEMMSEGENVQGKR